MPMVITNQICSVLVPIQLNPDAFGLIMTGLRNQLWPTWNPRMILKWSHLTIQIHMLIWMAMAMLILSSRLKNILKFGIMLVKKNWILCIAKVSNCRKNAEMIVKWVNWLSRILIWMGNWMCFFLYVWIRNVSNLKSISQQSR